MNKKAFKPFVIGFLMALVAIVVIAASPSFQSFNTNQFYVDASGNVVAVKSGALLTNTVITNGVFTNGTFSGNFNSGGVTTAMNGHATPEFTIDTFHFTTGDFAGTLTGGSFAGDFSGTFTGNGSGITGLSSVKTATNDAFGRPFTNTYVWSNNGISTNQYLSSPVFTNASIIGAVITPTNFFSPMFGVSSTAGTHTITTTNANFTWHKGDDIAVVGIGQYRVTGVARLTNITVDIINGSTFTLTTNWAYYPVGMRGVDINGTLEASVVAANDGSSILIGRTGGNSARHQFIGDSNQVWTMMLRSSGDLDFVSAQQEGNSINGAGDPNVMQISRLAPYESIHVLDDVAGVSIRVGLTNKQDKFFFMFAPTSFRQQALFNTATVTNTFTNLATIYAPSNTAPHLTVAQSLTLGTLWSNVYGTRVDFVGQFILTDAVGGQPILVTSNITTGLVLTNSFPQGLGSAAPSTVILPDLSPNDQINCIDASTGTGASVTFVRGFLIKK